MYATLLQVAHDIIIIWWALIIILGVVLMVVLLILWVRINKVVSKSFQTVSMVSEYIMLPFTYLAGIFSGSSSDSDEKPARRRTTSGKK